MDLRAQLIEFEGWRAEAYPDPLSGGQPWTIGVGHTGPDVARGLRWTDEQIGLALDRDILEKTRQCEAHFQWFESLNAPRQAVLIGMCFQMGLGTIVPPRGLLGFQQMLGAIRDERFSHAAECMRKSRWASQTPKRVVRMASQMETGLWA